MSEVTMAFDTLEDNTTPVVEAVTEEAKAETFTKLEQVEREAGRELILENPEIKDRLGIWSEAIEVVNTLGFQDKGSLINSVDPNNLYVLGEDGQPALNKQGKPVPVKVVVPAFVGVVIKNIGSFDIPFEKPVCTQVDGKWVKDYVPAVLKPGETQALSIYDLAKFASVIEIGFRFANADMCRKQYKDGDFIPKNREEALIPWYSIRFHKGTGLRIHSDDIKLPIAKKDKEGKWVVFKKFEEAFGILNDEFEAKLAIITDPYSKLKARRMTEDKATRGTKEPTKRAAKFKTNKHQFAALYIQSIAEKSAEVTE